MISKLICRCLQCACFDEDDDGIPCFCRHQLCPLDHRNKYLNDNNYIRQIGEIGYTYFDSRRKYFLGMASLVTVIAMVLTTFGCCALSTDPTVIKRVYWAAGTMTNVTSNQDYALYIGLRSVVVVGCRFVPGYDSYPPSCMTESIIWTDPNCLQGITAGACESCANIATSMWLTAFMSCFSLIFALLGALTRMRVKADVPVQKLLGMGADTMGSLSLAFALFTFENGCFKNLTLNSSNLVMRSNFWLGGGYACYLICCLSGFVRAIVHWLTPLPNKGKGLGAVFCVLCPCCCKHKEDTEGHSVSSSSSTHNPLIQDIGNYKSGNINKSRSRSERSVDSEVEMGMIPIT